MLQKPFYLVLVACSLTLNLKLLVGGNLPVQAQMQPASTVLRSPDQKGRLGFAPPKRGAPPSTAGGGSRGSCVNGETPLTVLTPFGSFGLTASGRPTFFLYIPPTTASSAEFVLKDASENDLYRTTIALSGNSGVLGLSLPETMPALEVGKDYHWYFSMICRPSDRLEDVVVSTWIQRIQPETRLVTALKTAVPRDRPDLYAEAGLWYETLATLADLRLSNPNDVKLTEDWVKLLQSVGLTQVAEAPLVTK